MNKIIKGLIIFVIIFIFLNINCCYCYATTYKEYQNQMTSHFQNETEDTSIDWSASFFNILKIFYYIVIVVANGVAVIRETYLGVKLIFFTLIPVKGSVGDIAGIKIDLAYWTAGCAIIFSFDAIIWGIAKALSNWAGSFTS